MICFRTHCTVVMGFLFCAVVMACARTKTIQHETLASYIERMQVANGRVDPSSPGSLWVDGGRLANLATDYKAMNVGDPITIVVVQDTSATNSGNVASDRSMKATSGIDGLAGHTSLSAVATLLALHSAQSLSGKAQAASGSSLRTSLSGRVSAILANGTLVVEAERQITMNNERQTVFLRGLIRPGDVSANNIVASNALGNLELELKGKGVISDGTRPPNPVIRTILRLVGF